MNYDELKSQILDECCSKEKKITQATIDYTLKYIEKNKISYMLNLEQIAKYIDREISQIISVIRPIGLKLYDCQYMNKTLYGFIVTRRIRQKIQSNLENYIKNICCKGCNSRFTKLVDGNTYCTSCGLTY